MKIEEEIKEMEADKGIDRLPSIEVENDFYHSNYDEIKQYQEYFGDNADIIGDYKNYLDTKYKNEIINPMTRDKYQKYINTLHHQFIDNYVQPLWENLLNHDLDKVNEIKKQMQEFLHK